MELKQLEKKILNSWQNHPFRFLWKGAEPANMETIQNAIKQVEAYAADMIYFNEPDPAPQSDLHEIFMPYHQNGTFMIGERMATRSGSSSPNDKNGKEFVGPFSHARNINKPVFYESNRSLQSPPFIRNEIAGFNEWARATALQDLMIMEYENVLPMDLSDTEKTQTAEIIAKAMEYTTSDEQQLYSVIPNQNYIDYFRRATSLYLYQKPDMPFLTEKRYDTISKEISISMVKQYFKSPAYYMHPDTLKELMVTAILSGSMGLDMKCSHCATSEISLQNTVFFDNGQTEQERLKSVHDWLATKTKKGMEMGEHLIAWDMYSSVVLQKSCRLVFFPDDYGETVFDLFQLQAQMEFNKQLSIIIIPRAGKYHNDASFEDIENILEEPCFDLMRQWRDSGRIKLSEHGPRNGGIEGPKISRQAASYILNADALYIKGSRSYELLATGLKIPTFAGQVVNREFSESIFGLDMRVGIPVLRYLHAFPDYWGFKQRHLRNEPLWPTNKLGWQVSMTAIESSKVTGSDYFCGFTTKELREKVSLEIMEKAIETGVAPHLIAAEKK